MSSQNNDQHGMALYCRIGGEAGPNAAMDGFYSRVLRGLGVPEDSIAEVAAAVTPLASQIVNTEETAL